jgi:hypothetical protein
MQEATFMILTALASGSQHGYGIITDVQEISGGLLRLRPGTLYTALDRLRADELIRVDREDLLPALPPERPRIAREQPPVTPLQVSLVSHVAIPPARSSRVSAALA